jgi:hypothetical protein
MTNYFPFIFSGLAAGLITTLIVGFGWPAIFPGIIRNEHYYGAGPSLAFLVGLVAVVVAPFSIVGGLVGSRIAIEGGEGEQKIMAAIGGVVAALPLTCYGLWQFSGW